MPDSQSVLRWIISLGIKFYRVVPMLTLAIVFLTLVAQIASLLAFFLPLKIIILLGSEGVPKYYPDLFAQLEKNHLIVLLSAATAGCYVLSLGANYLIAKVTEIAVKILLVKSHKMILFENQDEIAASAYKRYSSALAGAVFIMLALIGLGVMYPPIAVLISVYLLLASLIMSALYHRHENFRGYLVRKLDVALGFASNLGFFLVFGYLIIAFILLSPPGFITAVISFLIGRQIFGRAAAMVIGISGLAKQRQRLDAIFFHGKVLVETLAVSRKRSLWDYLAPGKNRKWIHSVLAEAGVVEWEESDLRIQWLEVSQPHVPHLLVRGKEADDAECLVKLFDRNKRSLALHEASLVTAVREQSLWPELLLATNVEDFSCLVYRLAPGHIVSPKKAASFVIDLNTKLFSLKLPESLIDRYQRSHPLLWDRLTTELIGRLYVASRKHKEIMPISELLDRLHELQSLLKGLPIVLHNPGIKSSIWISRENRQEQVLNWSRWSLEPLGASWYTSGGIGRLEKRFSLTAADQNNLRNIEPELAQLAALTYELERLICKQQLLSAVKLLPKIIVKMNMLK
ncbi:MAG: hypothetical protein ACI9LL_000767 [Porticoccus sp.]|jgi:hypothetical protein